MGEAYAEGAVSGRPTPEELAKIQRDADRSVADLNALVARWQAAGFRQEVMVGAFVGWLSAFSANGPTPDAVLEMIVEEIREQTAERRAAGPSITVAHARKT